MDSSGRRRLKQLILFSLWTSMDVRQRPGYNSLKAETGVRFPLGAPLAKTAVVIAAIFAVFVPLRFPVGQSTFWVRTSR
jgi:hypothetical protein